MTNCESEPDLWFSENQRGMKKAAALCTPCPMRLECLKAGMAEDYGVWGGATAKQRLAALDPTRDNPIACPACHAPAAELELYERPDLSHNRWPDRGMTCGRCAFEWRGGKAQTWLINQRAKGAA